MRFSASIRECPLKFPSVSRDAHQERCRTRFPTQLTFGLRRSRGLHARQKPAARAGTEMDEIIFARIAQADQEAADLDFKATFDPDSTGDWCELVKDIVAFANSGGGWIVFGVNDDGTLANADLGPLRKLDPAIVVDKIEKYTDQHFADFFVCKANRSGSEVVAMGISGVAM